MAESTRSKSNMDCLEEAIAKLTSNQLLLTANQNSMTLKLDELLQKLANLESRPLWCRLGSRSAMVEVSGTCLDKLQWPHHEIPSLRSCGRAQRGYQFWALCHQPPQLRWLMQTDGASAYFSTSAYWQQSSLRTKLLLFPPF